MFQFRTLEYARQAHLTLQDHVLLLKMEENITKHKQDNQ